MYKKTIKLFIKALVIGVLVNIGIQKIPLEPVSTSETNSQYEQMQPLKQSPVNILEADGQLLNRK